MNRIFVTYKEGVKRIIGVCCSFFCSANIKTKTDGMLQTIALPNNKCTKLIVCIRSSITKLNLKIENCFSFNKRIIYIRALLHWSCIFTHSHTFVLTYVVQQKNCLRREQDCTIFLKQKLWPFHRIYIVWHPLNEDDFYSLKWCKEPGSKN